MVNAQFSKHVASLETREGCPITPGASFTKTFYLVPVASSNKDRRGKNLPSSSVFFLLYCNPKTKRCEGKSCADFFFYLFLRVAEQKNT